MTLQIRFALSLTVLNASYLHVEAWLVDLFHIIIFISSVSEFDEYHDTILSNCDIVSGLPVILSGLNRPLLA